jgi:hypothetical protein
MRFAVDSKQIGDPPAKEGIQYAPAYRSITGVSGMLDHPLSRMKTAQVWSDHGPGS